MKSLLLVACLLCVPAFAQDATNIATDPQAAAKREIGVVIEDFRRAIIDKDKPRFLKLFPEGGRIAWQDAIGDASLQAVRRKKPDAPKVKIDPADSHLSFIDGIVEDKRSAEETFDNVRIDTDGDIASVIFDYRFLSDGRETNHGKEAWHLVRTDAGWKIVSVIWSMNWVPKPSASQSAPST